LRNNPCLRPIRSDSDPKERLPIKAHSPMILTARAPWVGENPRSRAKATICTKGTGTVKSMMTNTVNNNQKAGNRQTSCNDQPVKGVGAVITECAAAVTPSGRAFGVGGGSPSG